MFTARYALSPYIKHTRFVFKGLKHSVVCKRESQVNCWLDKGYIECRLGSTKVWMDINWGFLLCEQFAEKRRGIQVKGWLNDNY
jgi:hypothetical protein